MVRAGEVFLILLDLGFSRDSDCSWTIASCSAGLVFSRLAGFILSLRHFSYGSDHCFSS